MCVCVWNSQIWVFYIGLNKDLRFWHKVEKDERIDVKGLLIENKIIVKESIQFLDVGPRHVLSKTKTNQTNNSNNYKTKTKNTYEKWTNKQQNFRSNNSIQIEYLFFSRGSCKGLIGRSIRKGTTGLLSQELTWPLLFIEVLPLSLIGSTPNVGPVPTSNNTPGNTCVDFKAWPTINRVWEVKGINMKESGDHTLGMRWGRGTPVLQLGQFCVCVLI